MIYSSIGPNPRFFAAMTNALASSGNSKNAHKSTVRRMVISTGAPSVGAVSKRTGSAQRRPRRLAHLTSWNSFWA